MTNSHSIRSYFNEFNCYIEIFTHHITGQLSYDDLKDVRRAVWDARSKWKDIGVELGLRPATLENLKDEHRGNNACVTEMLTIWLKGLTPNPTWQALIDALKEPTVCEEALASQIQQQKLN